MLFEKYHKNPVIPRKQGTFGSVHMANPDLLDFKGRIFLYYRGQGNEKHDQIGVAHTDPVKFNGVDWLHYDKNPVVKVSDAKDAFDNRHILDPASVVIGGKVYLYYSGHSYDYPPGIGLAVSENGFDFQKPVNRPVMDNAFAPEVVIKDDVIHLFYQRKVDDHFEFFVCTSDDGIGFDKEDEKVIFRPAENKDELDSFSVSTCRIMQEDGIYYMTYGMCDKFDDYPIAFGLAKSTDLMNWQRFPGNPIMTRGKAGEWDEGAIWFGTVYKYSNTYYLYYEGTGAGLGTKSPKALSASEMCRNNDYGGYAKTSFSQIGLAAFKGQIPSF